MELMLTGITKKGKQRVQQHGIRWSILREVDKVLFDSREGPWLLINPVDNIGNTLASRWVHKTHDVNFVVTLE